MENYKLARNLLTSSNYPVALIDNRLKKFIYKNDGKSIPQTNTTSPVTYKGIYYIQSISENIGRVVCDGISDLKIGYKPYSTNSSNISILKDKSGIREQINVVYKIPCLGNGLPTNKCDLSYVGQTGNKLGTRLQQHERDLHGSNDEENSNKGHTPFSGWALSRF